MVGQFLIGVGIGIDFPASGSYVSEIMPRSLRSRMTVATIALQSVGMILAAVVAIAIFRIRPSTTDWRLPLGTGGLFAALYVCARLFLPESPRCLAEKAGSPKLQRFSLGSPIRPSDEMTKFLPSTTRNVSTKIEC